jgi:putative transposase
LTIPGVVGKSAFGIARNLMGPRRNFIGQHFWARGYYVSPVGLNEAITQRHIQNQDKEDRRIGQLMLVKDE